MEPREGETEERGAFASDEGHVLTGAGPFFISKSKQAACGGLGGYGKGGNSDANQAGAHFPLQQ